MGCMSASYLYSHFLRNSPKEPQPRLLAPSSVTSDFPPARLISHPSTIVPPQLRRVLNASRATQILLKSARKPL